MYIFYFKYTQLYLSIIPRKSWGKNQTERIKLALLISSMENAFVLLKKTYVPM